MLLRGERDDRDRERQQPHVTADDAPQEHRGAQERVTGHVGADRVDERGRAGCERDRREHHGRQHAGDGTELAEDRPRGDEDATADDEDRHEGHADVAAEQPDRGRQQVEMERAEMVDVACGVNVELR